MMVYPAVARPARVGVLLVFVLGMLAAASPLEARIGDTPEQMAARILQPNLGRNFSWPRDMPERERERLIREVPVQPFVHLLPDAREGLREQIFWKSALHRQLSNDNGWRVHVYFFNNRSVLELYRRVGQPLNDFEVNGILARMRGSQTWHRVARRDNVDSVIGYDFELGEGAQATLRARRQGDWLIIFHKGFDDLLHARKQEWEATEAQRRAELAVRQEREAPISIEGF